MNGLKALALDLFVMLREYLTSKKVLTAALTTLAGAFIKDPVLRDRAIAGGIFLIGAFAYVDRAKASPGGKEAVEGAIKTALLGELDRILKALATATPAAAAAPAPGLTAAEHAGLIKNALKETLLDLLDRARVDTAPPPVVVPTVTVGPAPIGVAVPSTTITTSTTTQTAPGFVAVPAALPAGGNR